MATKTITLTPTAGGSTITRTTDLATITITGIPLGTYTLKVVETGYPDYIQTVNVDSTKSITVTRTPNPVTPTPVIEWKKEVYQTVAVNYTTVQATDPNKLPSESGVTTVGVKGEDTIYREYEYSDGVKTGNWRNETTVRTKQPVNEVYTTGTKQETTGPRTFATGTVIKMPTQVVIYPTLADAQASTNGTSTTIEGQKGEVVDSSNGIHHLKPLSATSTYTYWVKDKSDMYLSEGVNLLKEGDLKANTAADTTTIFTPNPPSTLGTTTIQAKTNAGGVYFDGSIFIPGKKMIFRWKFKLKVGVMDKLGGPLVGSYGSYGEHTAMLDGAVLTGSTWGSGFPISDIVVDAIHMAEFRFDINPAATNSTPSNHKFGFTPRILAEPFTESTVETMGYELREVIAV